METHPVSIIAVLISGIGLLLTIIAFMVGTIRYITTRMEGMVDKVNLRIDTEKDKIDERLNGLIAKADVRYETVKEQIRSEVTSVSNLESKGRHDLANTVQNALAANRLQMDSFAKREEMRETEQRLTSSINKVGDKVDKLSEAVGKMDAMNNGIASLTAQLDRMAMRLDHSMPKLPMNGGD